MAERRMFTEKITESDVFLEMPLSSQCLYFHLCMYADDEGFVKNPKRIQRMVGATEDDLRVLIGKCFVLVYESGIIVIKHWRMHNLIRKDRFHPSEYIEEKEMLYVKENGAYTLDPSKGKPLVATKWQPNGNQMATEVRLGKDSIGKVNNIYPSSFNEFWQNYPRKQDKGQAYKCYQARLNDGYTEEQLLTACINYAAECDKDKREKKYIKVASTFLSVNEPFVEYLDKEATDERLSGRTESDISEERENEIREIIRRMESGEADDDDDGMWDDLP